MTFRTPARIARALAALAVPALLLTTVTPAPAEEVVTKSAAATAALAGLPMWKAPASYSVDMVMSAAGQTHTMKRFIGGDRIRTEMKAEGNEVVMIELGDEAGTTYTIVPKQKKAMKMSRTSMPAVEADDVAEETGEPADVKIEYLGEEKLEGATARKYRFSADEGALLAWFDAGSSAPLRMETTAEGEKAVVEWKNLKAGDQPDKLFEVPKGYEIIDMDEMMAKMNAMGVGQGAAGAMGGMTKNMGRTMMQGMGAGMGAGYGSNLGQALGGTLGEVAGRYIGGQVGGWVGGEAAEKATK